MQRVSECALCGGVGHKRIITKHSITGMLITKIVPCTCFISRIVSEENKLLQHLGGEYIPESKLSPLDNLVITGDYVSFLLNIKALLMNNLFLEKDKKRILLCRSIDIVHKFYVQQSDGNSPHLSEVSEYDLVSMVFGCMEHNQKLISCLIQVVATRVQEKKPTWIYLPPGRPNLLSCEQEYSPELDGYLKKFRHINVDGSKIVAAHKSQVMTGFVPPVKRGEK